VFLFVDVVLFFDTCLRNFHVVVFCVFSFCFDVVRFVMLVCAIVVLVFTRAAFNDEFSSKYYKLGVIVAASSDPFRCVILLICCVVC
jgi:hypothetical protein